MDRAGGPPHIPAARRSPRPASTRSGDRHRHGPGQGSLVGSRASAACQQRRRAVVLAAHRSRSAPAQAATRGAGRLRPGVRVCGYRARRAPVAGTLAYPSLGGSNAVACRRVQAPWRRHVPAVAPRCQGDDRAYERSCIRDSDRGQVNEQHRTTAGTRPPSFHRHYPVGAPQARIWNRALARADEVKRVPRPDPRDRQQAPRAGLDIVLRAPVGTA